MVRVARYLRKPLAQGVMVAVRVARFRKEAVGADVMVASMIRVIMDLRRLYLLQSLGPEISQFDYSSSRQTISIVVVVVSQGNPATGTFRVKK